MARYKYTIHHIPGKLLCTADALSRKPTLEAPGADSLEEEVESFVNGVINRSNDFGDSFKSRKKIPSAEEPGNTANLGGRKRSLNKLTLFRTGTLELHLP